MLRSLILIKNNLYLLKIKLTMASFNILQELTMSYFLIKITIKT